MTQAYWLFIDFDNTMMATEYIAVPSLVNRFNMLYAETIGRDLTVEEFKENFHGQAREALCQSLSQHFNIDVEFARLFDSREWRMMQVLHQTGVEMAPELVETLTELKAHRGFKFAFVSNNPIQRGLAAMRYATNGRGEELARLFGTAFFEAGDKQKPLPDAYLRAMEQVGATADRSFAVEDSVTGLISALSAGIKTFGFIGFADNKEEMRKKLLKNGAIACFTNWSELPALITKHSPLHASNN